MSMKLHANNALIPVVVLLLGGLAFALAVNDFTQEQTALRIILSNERAPRRRQRATASSKPTCGPCRRGSSRRNRPPG